VKNNTLALGPVETFELEQGTPEWWDVRMGIATASNFTKVKAGGEGKIRWRYMRMLAGEQITRMPAETFRNDAMDRGTAQEPALRSLYALMTNNEPIPCGFMRRRLGDYMIGCSPDSLIETKGMLEIKSAAAHVLIEVVEGNQIPPEHVAQCQGSLLVSGREYCDLFIGCPGMRPFYKRIPRDEAYITMLANFLDVFNRELAQMVERHK
jgi:predicted phage-related endonuclease